MSLAVPSPGETAALLLVLARILALCAVAPVFGHGGIPLPVRTGLAFWIALAFAPGLPLAAVPPEPGALWLAGAAAGEIAVGAALGFAARLVFDAVGVLGGFVSIQGGLGAASVIDPSSGAASTAFSALLEAVAILVFLGLDGHLALVAALRASFDALPLAGGGPGAASFLGIAGLGADLFSIAVRLAAPVTVAMALANVVMGILGRAMPEMNLMIVQMPAHVLLVLALLLAGVVPFADALARTVAGWPAHAFGTVLGGG